MLSLSLSKPMPDLQKVHSTLYPSKKLIESIKTPTYVNKLVTPITNKNIEPFSSVGGWNSAKDRITHETSLNISFPPQPNVYQVSVGVRELKLTPLPPTPDPVNKVIAWRSGSKNQLLDALNLEHSVIHWLERMQRHYKRSETNINVHTNIPGILMDKQRDLKLKKCSLV